MRFRTKLLMASTLVALGGGALFSWGATRYAQRQFDEFDKQRSDTLVAQFRRELAQRADEVASNVQDIAEAESTVRMALDLSRPQADFSLYANDAHGLAASHHLDFLELFANDGSLISSAQWPGRVGYQNEQITHEQDGNRRGAFLERVELPDGAELGMLAMRAVSVGNSNFYILGGRRMDGDFLHTLASPAGTRALLYQNLSNGFVPAALTSPGGPVADGDRFAPLLASASGQHGMWEQTIQWNADPGSAEHFVAVPLNGRQNKLLGVLLVGSEQQERAILLNQILALSVVMAATGVLLGIFLSWWVSASVSRPLARLAAGAQKVSAGDLGTQVAARSRDEVGCAVRAFNAMIRQLAEQRRGALETERVAAWREVALRMAHETKERLFPLQVAVESVRRAREQNPERLDEVFLESLATLTAELEKLKTSVKRFGDFAKMPAPRLEPVDLNETLRSVVKRFEPQFSAIGRPPVTPELFLDDGVARISADPEQLSRSFESLLLRSLDSMPAGGSLTIRTRQGRGLVRVEVTDTGTGLLPEECARMFTPYYAVGQQTAGLGLATVQSIVSEHGGKIFAESAPKGGTTFRMEFPAAEGRDSVTPASAIAGPSNSKAALPQTPSPDLETAAPPFSYQR
jgi:two-component system nitrogen regulation sensor histidine kinase NtrY